MLIQKRFYNRETINAMNHEMHKSLLHPLFLCASQIINPFLNSRISVNHGKVESHSAKMMKPSQRELFLYIVESLLLIVRTVVACL